MSVPKHKLLLCAIAGALVGTLALSSLPTIAERPDKQADATLHHAEMTPDTVGQPQWTEPTRHVDCTKLMGSKRQIACLQREINAMNKRIASMAAYIIEHNELRIRPLADHPPQ